MELITKEQIGLSKAQLEEMAIQKANEDLEVMDSIEVYTFMKKLTDYAGKYMEVVKGKAIEYLTARGGKDVALYGSKITIRNGYDVLDYTKDPIYSELQEKLKERQELLKMAHKHKGQYFDGDGIEVPKVPVKSATSDSIIYKY
jgi:hypothetical protein